MFHHNKRYDLGLNHLDTNEDWNADAHRSDPFREPERTLRMTDETDVSSITSQYRYGGGGGKGGSGPRLLHKGRGGGGAGGGGITPDQLQAILDRQNKSTHDLLTHITESQREFNDKMLQMHEKLLEKTATQAPPPPPAPSPLSSSPVVDTINARMQERKSINDAIEAIKEDWSGKTQSPDRVAQLRMIEDVEQRLREMQKKGEKIPEELKLGIPFEQVTEILQIQRHAHYIACNYKNDSRRYHNEVTTSMSVGVDIVQMMFEAIQPWGYTLEGFSEQVDEMLNEPDVREAFAQIYQRSGMSYNSNPYRTVFMKIVKLFTKKIQSQMCKKSLQKIKQVKKRRDAIAAAPSAPDDSWKLGLGGGGGGRSSAPTPAPVPDTQAGPGPVRSAAAMASAMDVKGMMPRSPPQSNPYVTTGVGGGSDEDPVIEPPSKGMQPMGSGVMNMVTGGLARVHGKMGRGDKLNKDLNETTERELREMEQEQARKMGQILGSKGIPIAAP
jgi:hypothetical protein